ncbi:MAG TPA: DUF418 domain-containing protein [Sulfurimonas sp.]|nr:DUF418 domain-containing protein [Sulfurimonas sp.]HIM75925.1 DUF418 domain-containing protein [Campylobacterales bacterium]
MLKKKRIEILDVIRGFAIFGIILANIQSWSGYKFIPFTLLETLPYYEYNSIGKALFLFFIDTKFYTLFSLLFGIGFFIQFDKHRENQKPFVKTYTRLLLFLMLFGSIHAFFWSGDILLIYGAMGLLLIPFRNLALKNLLTSAIVLYYIWLIYDLFLALYYPDLFKHDSLAYKTYIDITPGALTSIFTQGSFIEVLQANWHNLYWRYLDLIPSGRLTKVLAIFILGYYMMSIDYFRVYLNSKKLLLLYFVSGSAFTYLSFIIGGSMSSYFHDLTNVLYKFISATGQVLLALSYIHILSYLYQMSFFKKAFKGFAYVGRMSFTNYLMHTFFGYLIFYPFFSGYFGTMGLVEISLLALCLYTLQIFISILWFRFFIIGPLEWAWRSLILKKLMPIRKEVF